MSTVMLHEKLGTKYPIDTIDLLVSRTLRECADNGNVVDLAYCRFGPKCAQLLNEFYGKVKFINSELPEWDIILQNNMEAATAVYEEYKPLKLLLTDDMKELILWIKSLPADKYKPEVDLTNIRHRAILTLLIMARPDIEFDIRRTAADIFNFVRDAWVNSAKEHSSYWILRAPDIELLREANGVFKDSIGTVYDRDTLLRDYKVLPAEFGNSQIITFTNPIEEEWMPVLNKCVHILTAHTAAKQNKAKGKTVRNFVAVRKEIKR